MLVVARVGRSAERTTTSPACPRASTQPHTRTHQHARTPQLKRVHFRKFRAHALTPRGCERRTTHARRNGALPSVAPTGVPLRPPLSACAPPLGALGGAPSRSAKTHTSVLRTKRPRKKHENTTRAGTARSPPWLRRESPFAPLRYARGRSQPLGGCFTLCTSCPPLPA